MAARHWIGGSGTQLYTDPLNWAGSDGGATVNDTPDAGDDVYILRGNSNIAGADESSVALASFTCSFNGSLGTSGTPLKIGVAKNANNSFIEFQMRGAYRDSYISLLLNDAARAQFLGVGAGSVTLVDLTPAGSIYVGPGGQLVVKSACLLSNSTLENLGGSVFIESGTKLTTGRSFGGSMTIARGVDTLEVYGGIVYSVMTSGSPSLVEVHNGGTYSHQTLATIAGLFVYPGGFATSSDAPGPFTVTLSTLYAGGSKFENSPVLITYTNPTIPIGFV